MALKNKNLLLLFLFFYLPLKAESADMMKDFESFGQNKDLLEKAYLLNPELKIKVVQNRSVPRIRRSEVFLEYARILNGDIYIRTQNASFNYQFHLTPRWSMGLRYTYSMNRLTSEGEWLVSSHSKESGASFVPDLDYPKSSYLAVLNWYPFYGKVNLYDLGVLQFDFYGLAGAGEIHLYSGTSSLYMAGLGVGLWFSQHLTSRIEYRYQVYRSDRKTGSSDMYLGSLGLALGYLF